MRLLTALMIILKKLTWSNLFSYADNNSIDLSENSITQLVGLNGHGKSSIPLILEETLFNKNSKGIKKGDVPNRLLDTNKYSMSCNFTISDKDYVLTINRSGATQKVKLIENGLDISSHTATGTFAQLESLFGLDFKTFSQLVYQNNNSSLQFLTATDSNRKKFLIDLLSLDKYLVIFESIKTAYKNVSDSLLKLHAKEATIRSWLEDASKTDLTYLSLNLIPSLDSTKVTELGTLKAKLADITSINTKISTNNHYKSRIEAINTEDLVCRTTLVSPKDLETKRAEVQHEIKQHQATIKKYSGLTSGECPTCTQTIDTLKIQTIVDVSKALVEARKVAEKEILRQLAEIEENNKIVTAHQQLVAEFEKFSVLVDNSLPNIFLDKEEIESKIGELSTYIDTLNKEIDKISKSNNTISAHNAKVLTVKGQLDDYQKALNELSVDLVTLDKQIAILEVLKKAFSTTGLIAYKIENSVKALEELTNSYLAELSDGRFELLFALANDKLNVVIVDNGVEIDIAALSAGELTRVTTATLLAIRKLMASLSKNRINVLFLDETIEALDMQGKERLIEVLLREEDLNTFIISHSYNHPLVPKLQVIKEQGISRIDNG